MGPPFFLGSLLRKGGIMDACIFCKIVSGQIPCIKIFENEDVLSFLDIGPISDGHTLVIPKQHYETVAQCPPEVMEKVGRVLPKIALAVQQGMDSDAYNVLCNNGRAAGQLVDHVHFHIIPRNSNDGVFNRWPSYQYPEGKAEQISENLRKKLEK